MTRDDKTSQPVREPIAIVGIGCRYPDADDARELWSLISEGRSAIREVPSDRFSIDAFHDSRPGARGKLSSRLGGFLADPWGFDAERFGISPREAARIDPQHRLMLEVCAQALEDGFLTRSELAQHVGGVYIGCWASDWECHEYAERDNTDVYSMPGAARCLISGRLSFAFDLRGPSLTVDTGCSASLIATHLACQSLWLGECSLAVCGGVNLVLDPKPGLSFSLAGMLATDGQCKAYDSRADGFVRSDGCGAIVLMPLSAARARGSRIYAVIRGSGASNDGFSNGLLTTPSEIGQEAAMRAAYRSAGLQPSDVQYIEGHGTGTRAGDPVELRALGSLMRERPDNDPCYLGSIKTNIGHTEGAAGVAGLIKAALSLHHRVIPQSLNFESPTDLVEWQDLKLAVARESRPWPEGVARAGVSSFGISGTDVHIVLEEVAAPRAHTSAERDASELLTISGGTEQALRANANAYRELLSRPAADSGTLSEICYSAALGRDAFARRLAVVSSSRAGMIEALDAYLADEPHPALSVERASTQARGPVFVFSGQGSQWIGMGLSLMAAEPSFRATLEACSAALQPHTGWSLIEELRREREAGHIPIDIIQPSIFAMQVALAQWLGKLGVKPEIVVGHSMGEVAAAHVAGALSLDDAARIICHRSRVLENVTGQGAMLSVELGFEAASELLADYRGRVSVAAENGLQTTVLSGEPEALAEIAQQLEAREIFCRDVQVAAAAHSPQLDPQLPWLRCVLEGIQRAPLHTPLCSTVTAVEVSQDELGTDYWVRNMREPVRFCTVIQALLEQGYTRFVELSPHPVLLGPIQQIAQGLHKQVTTTSSLRRDQPEREQLLLALARLHTLGQPVDFRALYDASNARFVRLPGYALQRDRYDAMPRGAAAGATSETASLGTPLRSSVHPKTYLWEVVLAPERSSYLADHSVSGAVTLPGAAYVDMALQAATEVFGSAPFVIEQLELTTALIIPAQSEVRLQISLNREQPGIATIDFRTQLTSGEGDFSTHASACARLLEVAPPLPAALAAAELRASCDAFELDQHFRTTSEHGIVYGPAFQGLRELWVSEREALARAELPSKVAFQSGACVIHPALLDACWQAAAALLFSQAGHAALFLPVGVESVQRFGTPGTEVLAHAQLRSSLFAPEIVLDVGIYDRDGQPLVLTSGLRLRKLAAQASLDDAVYGQQWREEARVRAAAAEPDLRGQNWLVLLDRTRGLGARIAHALSARGARCVCAYAEKAGELDAHVVDFARPETLSDLVDSALSAGTLHGVVDLWPLDAVPTASATAQTLIEAQDIGAIGLTQLLQALDARDQQQLKLWVVTAETQPVTQEQAIEIAQAPLWALARVLRVELPQLQLQCIDLSVASDLAEEQQLIEELLEPDDRHEDHLALRANQRFVMRWVRAPLSAARPAAVPVALDAQTQFQLTMPAPGILDQLELRQSERERPGPGEVEIEVGAAGMNFIDVMKALGIYPGLGDELVVFGGECAGRISALGEGISGLVVGQRVIALGSRQGSFGRYCVTRACLAAPLPEHLSFAQGATIPAVFLTAEYALQRLARLARGERVLIHSGTGGVGLAAIALAHSVGAEVVATAGSEAKRQYLRDLGISHVFDSRGTTFAAEILAATGGEGVDVVLNSLAGDAIPLSLSLLRDDGRFLEIGKRDIYADMQLGLSPFKRGLSFAHIDLARLARDRAELLGELLRGLVERFERRELEPLPVELFPISQAAAAFRHMAQAKHIGKIVLSLEDPELSGNVLPSRALVRSDASYLVTGGLSGIGLLTAQWLAEQGAKHLVLLGRRAASDETLTALEQLRASGVEVHVYACDVADAAAVERVLANVSEALPPLRGVIHSAGLLDDGLAQKLTRERFWNVMRPKLLGAFHLHKLTARHALDFFVMFSSGAAALGSPGQANYAAANEFMDALAHARRHAGLPALAIDWGTWSETGMATGAARAGRLLLRGMGTMSNREGLQLLGALMRSERTRAICLVNADVRRWVQFNPTAGKGGMLLDLLEASAEQLNDSGLRASILSAAPEARASVMTEYVVDVVRRVLRIPASKPLDVDVPLNRMGLDSLMAVEMKNRLEYDLSTTIPVSKILMCTGLGQLAEQLLETVLGAVPAVEAQRIVADSQPTAAGGLSGLLLDLDAGADVLEDHAVALA